MSDKKINEENLKKYIATLKSQLAFYRGRCLELQQKEWKEQELEENLKELKELHEQEKNQLLEQINILKSFINDVSTLRDTKTHQLTTTYEEKREKEKDKNKNKEQYSYLKPERESGKKKASSDDWFMRVLHQQNAIDNN